MKRLEDWERRLFAYTSAALHLPYEWGKNDCVTFAADCVEAQTGVDPIADLRGSWRGEQTAAKVIYSLGVNSLGDAAALFLPNEVTPSLAQRGDIVLCVADDVTFLAVCQGATAVGPTEGGLIHVPMRQAVRAFRVGE